MLPEAKGVLLRQEVSPVQDRAASGEATHAGAAGSPCWPLTTCALTISRTPQSLHNLGLQNAVRHSVIAEPKQQTSLLGNTLLQVVLAVWRPSVPDWSNYKSRLPGLHKLIINYQWSLNVFVDDSRSPQAW